MTSHGPGSPSLNISKTDESQPELPAEPDRTGDELTVVTGMLDYFRAVMLRKTWGLSDAQLSATIEPSDLSLAGLLWHMALVEDTWFEERLAGRATPEPWASMDWDADRDWEFHNATTLTRRELVDQLETSVARSRAVLAEAASLDDVAVQSSPDGTPVRLRWIMVHMIEEYARHCGHADLLREAIDGVTGD